MKEGVERNQEERLIQLIRLKRYEQPSDMYFESLPHRIMSRIQALEQRKRSWSRWALWWEGLRMQRGPVAATACLAAGIGFLMGFWLRSMIGPSPISASSVEMEGRLSSVPVERTLSPSPSMQTTVSTGSVFLQPIPSSLAQTDVPGLRTMREVSSTDSLPFTLPTLNWAERSRWWGPTGWEFSIFVGSQWDLSNQELGPFLVIPFEEEVPQQVVQPASYPTSP